MEVLLTLALSVGVIVLILYGIAYRTVKKIENAPLNETDIYLQGKDVHYVTYYGGFDDISMVGLRMTNIVFNDSDLEFNFRHDNYDNISETRKIKYTNIKNLKYMNKTTIEEKMRLGAMLVFGVLSLGMKQKEEVNQEFIVIDYKKNDEVGSVVIYVEPKESRIVFNKIKDKMVYKEK